LSDQPEGALGSAQAPVSAPAPAPGSASGPEADTGTGAPDQRPGIALILRRFAIAIVLVGIDLWSKAAAFEWLASAKLTLDSCEFSHRRVPLVGEWFAFMLSRNKGAAFGQLDSVPYLLVGGRVLAVLFLCFLIVRSSPAKRLLTAALVLILAGALGNLYDNLLLDPPSYDSQHPFGYVRDFIDVYFVRWNWHFPTFNVADSCITVGAALLLITGLGKDEEKTEAAS